MTPLLLNADVQTYDFRGDAGPVHAGVAPEGCGCAQCAGASAVEGGEAVGAEAGKPVWTLEQIVGNALRSNVEWTQPANVTYSFRESTPPGADRGTQFSAFSDVERELTRLAFDLISDVANITFVEAPDDGRSTENGRRIYFGKDANLPDYEWGHASRYSFDTSPRRTIASAEIWVNTDQAAQRAWIVGGHNFQSLMHEVGHSIGLPHPGDYNANGQPITYANDAQFEQDSRQYTVMSYFAASNTGADHVADSRNAGIYAPSTPMLHDVAALQALYGANMTTRVGDTTYGYGSTAGRASFDILLNPTPIYCIWDAGGVDLLDFSGTAFAVNLDLNAGAFSDAFEMTRNISIAFNVTIENASSGSADDRILGNDVGNVLRGGAGNDLLQGAGGDDRLEGGEGTDRLEGGEGSDQLLGQDGDDALRGDAGADSLDGGAGLDNLFGGEGADLLEGRVGNDRLHGEGGDDLIGGQEGEDYIDGGAGRDALFGDAGADFVVGGADNDRLHGQDGDDLMGGNDGEDYLNGGAGRDELHGDAGADFLEGGGDDDRQFGEDGDDLMGGQDGADYLNGGAGRDALYGDAGNDFLEGGADNDRQFGGDGDDLMGGQSGDDYMDGGAGRDALYGDAGNDFLEGKADDDRLHGGDGDDLIGGQDGADHLEGGAGRDALYGDAGNDVIVGGAGADSLFGQGGADRFVFIGLGDSAGGELDRIFDFSLAAGDRIDVSQIDADAFAAGDQAFALVGGFSGRAGQAVLAFDGANTTLSLDVNGDSVADFRLLIDGRLDDPAGFIL